MVSGDYKRRPDPTCQPFQPVPCDIFVTEATFGLPVFHHPDTRSEIDRLLERLRDLVAREAIGLGPEQHGRAFAGGDGGLDLALVGDVAGDEAGAELAGEGSRRGQVGVPGRPGRGEASKEPRRSPWVVMPIRSSGSVAAAGNRCACSARCAARTGSGTSTRPPP